MFNSTILDVGIGLIVVYLVASLGVTALNEFIAALMRLRARTLCAGVTQLLQGDTELVKKFYGHPLIKGLSRDAHKPSYIPARTFVLATLGTVSGEAALVQRSVEGIIANVPNAELQRVLRLFAGEAKGDVDALLKRMEGWYDESMERVGGWYKRHVQFISLGLAVFIAVALNIDTVRLANVLWTNGPARQAILAYADVLRKERSPALSGETEAPAMTGGTARTNPPTPLTTQGSDKAVSPAPAQAGIDAAGKAGKDVADKVEKLIQAGLPIGWDHCPTLNDVASLPGWIISALAISLGAPFWFDVLNRFMEIRSSGKAPKEPPKPPEDQSREVKVFVGGQAGDQPAPTAASQPATARPPTTQPDATAPKAGPQPVAHSMFRR